ncbi:MAG: WapI family immunity protein [Blastococcus sp.]
MLLTSDDGASVELRIAGYECPDVDLPDDADPEWDLNWLVVEGRGRTADGDTWSITEPILTTWEARQLAVWLRVVVRGRIRRYRRRRNGMLTFTEPNLAFALRRHDGEDVVLRVRVGHAAVALHLTTAALRGALADWERELSAYPRR